jgi:hypothetical protein
MGGLILRRYLHVYFMELRRIKKNITIDDIGIEILSCNLPDIRRKFLLLYYDVLFHSFCFGTNEYMNS